MHERRKKVDKVDILRNKNTGHPAIVVKKQGHQFYYFSVTHSKVVDGVENIKLGVNLNPNDKSVTYVRPILFKDKKQNFEDVYKNWKTLKVDRNKLKKYEK